MVILNKWLINWNIHDFKKKPDSFLGANKMATEISQLSKATQWILITAVDDSKYCFPVALVFQIVTFNLVLKISHLERSSIMTLCLLHFGSNGTTHTLPHPSVTLPGQSSLWQDISRVFTCSLWAERPEISHDICHFLCGFCRWCCFSCLNQIFFTPASLLSLISGFQLHTSLCSKCEAFKVGNLFFFLIVLLNKALFLTALNLFWNQMHSNTSGCRQSSCMSYEQQRYFKNPELQPNLVL